MADRYDILQLDIWNQMGNSPLDSFYSIASSNIIYRENCGCPMVNETNKYKYLGMTFESDLRWKSHIKNLITKLRLGCVVLSRLKNVASIDFRKKTLLCVYPLAVKVWYTVIRGKFCHFDHSGY